jgi:lipopolysaccharide biosynthesis glycosyltransferase
MPISVHLLVSSKTWKMGLMAVLSLEYFSGKRWRIFIHEDGSLDESSQRAILAKLPGAVLVTRQEADDVFNSRFRGYPACVRNRANHNFFLKFFDPWIYSPEEKYVLLDADVIFYRNPLEVMEWASCTGKSCLYMRDIKEVFCTSRSRIEEFSAIRIPSPFNAGFLCMEKSAIDPDFCERFLLEFESRSEYPQFLEQTLHALCASRCESVQELPGTYEMTWNLRRRPDAICRHYVGPAKFDHLYLESPLALFFHMTLPKMMFSVFKES